MKGLVLLLIGWSLSGIAFAEASKSKGVGPIKELKLSATVDAKQAEAGASTFKMKCSPCHLLEKKKVGPALNGVTQRRTPEWIMNMILNPSEMIQKDEVAMKLFEEHLVPMTFQNVKEEDARNILEYFRSVDEKAGSPADKAASSKPADKSASKAPK